MSTLTVVLLVCVAIGSAIATYIHYFFREQARPKYLWFLAIMRFLGLFFIGALLVNPTVAFMETTTTKPVLNVLFDNSASVKALKKEEQVEKIRKIILEDKQLQDKFDLVAFAFGAQPTTLSDSLVFDQPYTDITKALKGSEKLFNKRNRVQVLITDGNQTKGNAYQLERFLAPIYPLVIGDTTAVEDLSIERVNVNKYSYIGNKFPVEVQVNYEGKETVNTVFELYHKSKLVYREPLVLSAAKNFKQVQCFVTSEKVGLQFYRAVVKKIKSEKNTKNNSRSFSIEVLNEKSKVLLVSAVMHPDLGALKKAIERSEQRSVTITTPTRAVKDIASYDLVIAYQPNQQFKQLFDVRSSNMLIVTGSQTDWSFLNARSLGIKKQAIQKSEGYGAVYNPDFLSFVQKNIGFEEFPPLEDKFGRMRVTKEAKVLLYQNITGLDTKQPLLVTFDGQEGRFSWLLGEGLWKWRAAYFAVNDNFDDFDEFLGNFVQFTSDREKKERLSLRYDRIVPANLSVDLTAYYVDETYRFDPRAALEIQVRDSDKKEVTRVPFSLKGNVFEVRLEGLKPGKYSFIVVVKGQDLKRYGSFEIVPYSLEEQFTTASKEKLELLAAQSKGKLFYSDQTKELVNTLLTNSNLQPLQSEKLIEKSLLDWYWILLVIAGLFSAEWFTRKYFGKI